MAKTFNTAGPCRPDDHYMPPPERRLERILPLIKLKVFLVVHAPRQSGLEQKLEAEKRFEIELKVGRSEAWLRGRRIAVWR